MPRRSPVSAAAALVAAALLCAPAAFAKDKKEKPADRTGGPPFEVVLEAENTDFSAEDSITMTATVYNNTDQDAIIDVGRIGAAGKYDLMTTDGDDVLESGMWEPDRDLKPHKVTLKAHRSVSRFVNLTKELAQLLREEGKIRVTLDVCDTAFGGDAAKPRCIASNGIILHVFREAGATQIHR